MFRPEQLVIDLLVPGADAGGIVARIAAAEFQGSSQLLTLEIAGTPGLELPVASGIHYRVGDEVTIRTIGDAIVFPTS